MTSDNSKAVASDALFGVWSPIETAPKDGRAILLFGLLPGSMGYSDDSLIMSVGGWSGERWGAEANNGRFVMFLKPTHWMPLPNPPNPTGHILRSNNCAPGCSTLNG